MRGPWQQDVNGSEVVVCVRGVTRVSLNDHVVEIVELALLQVRRHIGGARVRARRADISPPLLVSVAGWVNARANLGRDSDGW